MGWGSAFPAVAYPVADLVGQRKPPALYDVPRLLRIEVDVHRRGNQQSRDSEVLVLENSETEQVSRNRIDWDRRPIRGPEGP